MSSPDPVIPSSLPPGRVVAGFTTREGGVSKGPFGSLNCGTGTGDDPESVRENRCRVFRHAGVDERHVAAMGQVHGTAVSVVESGGVFGETDGLLTVRAGILLTVLVADCIPLLLYDPVNEAAGIIHCGWRPITGGIAAGALDLMKRSFSTGSADVLAVMGPSAGPCCYRIGADVADRLDAGSVIGRDGALYGDLRAELHGRLTGAGIAAGNIEYIDHCTVCKESRYFSYRRDGRDSGRMMGFIMLKGGDS